MMVHSACCTLAQVRRGRNVGAFSPSACWGRCRGTRQRGLFVTMPWVGPHATKPPVEGDQEAMLRAAVTVASGKIGPLTWRTPHHSFSMFLRRSI